MRYITLSMIFVLSSLHSQAQWVELVKDICINSCGADPQEYISLKDVLYFNASTMTGKYNLFVKTDGTKAGTKIIKDADGNFSNFTLFNDKIYMFGPDSETGEELYMYDPNTQTVSLCKDITPGTQGSNLTDLIATTNKLFFFRDKTLWVSDGTSTGTKEVITKNLFSHHLYSLKNRVYFLTANNGTGTGIWTSDGTPGGTYSIKEDMYFGGIYIHERVFYEYNDKLYFAAGLYKGYLAITDVELWVTDGTEAGTKEILDLNTTGSSIPNNFIPFNNSLYFTAVGTSSNRAIWKTDGTAAGTIKIIDLGEEITNFMPCNGKLCFGNMTVSPSGIVRIPLWVTDGTAQGTQSLRDDILIYRGADPSTITYQSHKEYATSNNKLYFPGVNTIAANPSPSQRDMCMTDGTAQGTFIMLPPNGIPNSGNLSYSNSYYYLQVAASGNEIFYSAQYNPLLGFELCKITNHPVNIAALNKQSLAIYPNPVSDILNIETDNNTNTAIRIISVTGRTMLQQEISTAKGTVEVSQLPAGIYFMHITSKGATKVEKFVKK